MQRSTAVQLDAAQEAAAAQGLKAMMPDARGRPFLDHVIASLADAGIRDVCLVVRADDDTIGPHYRDHPPIRVTISCAYQAVPRGTANALLAAEDWAGEQPLLVLNADNLYPVDAITALCQLDGPGLLAFDRVALIAKSNIDADRLASFAVIRLGANDQLTDIVEKPAALTPADRWISMNIWQFDVHIFAACRAVSPSPRGELELPLAVRWALAHGMRLHAVRVEAGVLDLSSRDDVGTVAKLLADRAAVP
jgi:glucose-1-phosphate thymidylyltransferase